MDLADNTLCDFMLDSSEGEERSSDGRRRKRWSAAPSEKGTTFLSCSSSQRVLLIHKIQNKIHRNYNDEKRAALLLSVLLGTRYDLSWFGAGAFAMCATIQSTAHSHHGPSSQYRTLCAPTVSLAPVLEQFVTKSRVCFFRVLQN